MRSPEDMNFIQIDITNACNKACSNCTRFCGNHEKTFFMDFETFKRAVDSLYDYHGVTGIIGGEPTLHPEFERFAEYLIKKHGRWAENNRLLYPQRDFIDEIKHRENETYRPLKKADGSVILKTKGPGLWSNMGATYRKHYEIIQDVFGVQLLNDHINPSYHQPGLFSRKDLGISDEEWIPMRDACWIQNNWSATITPKGAFFCEIAGALDMLFDGPGGWPIEPGWWKRKPEDFTEQLHWCEICGFALDTFMRNAEEEIDDVSPTLYEMLKEKNSPKMKDGRINCVKIENGVILDESKAKGQHYTESMPYLEHYEDRFNEANSVLFKCDYTLIGLNEKSDNFGTWFNNKIKESSDWLLLYKGISGDTAQKEGDKLISEYILNPGTLHCGDGWYLLCKYAHSLRKIGFDGVAHSKSFEDIVYAWEKEKVISISEIEEKTRITRKAILPEKRYAIWGTGISGAYFADIVRDSNGVLAFAVDSDETKKGCEWKGVTVCSPEDLSGRDGDFDYIIIGHLTKYQEIQKSIIEIGIDENRIILPEGLVTDMLGELS